MDKNNIKFINFIKEHRFKLIGLSLAAILFSLLIIEAIYLLTLPNNNSNSRSNNPKSSSSDNSKNSQNKNNNKNNKNSKNNPYQNPEQDQRQDPYKNNKDYPNRNNKNGMEPYGNYGEGNGTIDPKLRGSLKNAMPNVEIDLGRNKEYPNTQFGGGGGNSFSVQTGKKPQHTPILEIAGSTETGFLRMSTMDNFNTNKWIISPNAYYEMYKGSSAGGLKSVKLKPFNDAKGFIPVPSNSTSVRFPVRDVVNFPDNNMFYTDTLINDYYEAFFKLNHRAGEFLISSDVVSNVYDMRGMDEIASIARKVTEGKSRGYEEIAAIEKYLKENYTIETSKGPGDFSYNASDFFRLKKGSRLDFVSSFVLMLRSINIPSRMAVGYKIDPDKNYQVVYADQLYVYAEIKSIDAEWVPVDFIAANLYTPPVETKIEITSVEETAKKGTEFNVSGKVTDSAGNPVDGITVMIYVKSDKDEGCLAYERGEVSKGKFHVKSVVNRQMDVGVYNIVAHAVENDKYKGSWSDPEMKITSDTRVSVTAPASVFESAAFTLKGNILEEQTSCPVKGGEIKLDFGNSFEPSQAGSISIGKKGEFGRDINLKVKKGVKPQKDYFFIQGYRTSYTLSYAGTDFYLPCEKNGQIVIWSILWQRIIYALVLLIVIPAVVIFVLFYRKRKKLAVSAIPDVSTDIDNMIRKYSGEAFCKSTEQNIIITFPQITHPFPEIWGVNDPLTIRFTADNGDYDEKNIDFSQKGNKIIAVYSEMKDIVARKDIRIVSYREEITLEVKKVLEELGGKFQIHNTRKMTAREIVERISPEVRESVDRELKGVILAFENAAYSLKPVKRAQYEQCFKYILVLNKWLEEVLK